MRTSQVVSQVFIEFLSEFQWKGMMPATCVAKKRLASIRVPCKCWCFPFCQAALISLLFFEICLKTGHNHSETLFPGAALSSCVVCRVMQALLTCTAVHFKKGSNTNFVVIFLHLTLLFLLLSFSFILRCCFCCLLTCHNLREYQQWFDFVTGSLIPPPSLLWEAWWRRSTLSWDRQVETKRGVHLHICQKFSKNAAIARSWLKIRSYLRLTLEIECTWCWLAPLS